MLASCGAWVAAEVLAPDSAQVTQPHATPSQSRTGLRPRVKTETCTECHADLAGRPVTHAPVAQGRCTDCHTYTSIEQHQFRLKAPTETLCLACHQPTPGRHVHAPVADGDCLACHDPHGSDHPTMLVADAGRGLCISCHDDYLDRDFVHGPVAVQACLVCHEPHAGPNAGLLTAPPERLCFDCHAEKQPIGSAARHLHKPMSDGCTGCHDPHASGFRFQLQDEGSDLCLSCHDGVKHVLATSAVTHAPLSQDNGCATCHDPHFTALPYLQKKKQPQLCLECHAEPVTASDGTVLADMAALLTENPNHHGPIRQGSCTACHQAHGSNHFRLLLKESPADFYTSFKTERYALCFSCHLSGLVEDRSGTGLTGFRDGDLNLHWVHVNREKGRTCRACHDVHASKNPFHIRESVPFGSSGWMLDINFQQNDEGGQCASACHKLKTYRRSATPAGEGRAISR